MGDKDLENQRPSYGSKAADPENEPFSTLMEGLRHPEDGVRRLALESIADIMDDDLAVEVLRLVGEDANEDLRAQAATTLGPALEACSDEDFEDPLYGCPLSRGGYQDLIRRLKKLYHDAGVPKLVRRRVLEAAVRSPQPWHEGSVRSAFRSDDPDWRVTAVACMAYVPGFEAEVLEAFRSEHRTLRIEAIRTAGILGLKEVGADLLALARADQAHPELRLAAIGALPGIEPPGTLEVLSSLSTSEVAEIAAASADAVYRMQASSACEEADNGPRAPDDGP